MMNRHLISFLFLVVLYMGGCASQNIHFTNTVANPTSQDQEYLQRNFVLIKRDASITFNRDFFVYIPLSGFQSFSNELVVDTLLQQYDADLITDLKIDENVMLFVFYNRYSVVGQGDVWRRK